MTPIEYAEKKSKENLVAAFRPGIYRHWKGNLYRALFLAQDSTNRPTKKMTLRLDTVFESTEAPVVIYVSLDPGDHAGNVCARDLEQWNELVPDVDADGAPHPVPRFEFVRP